MEAAGRNDAGLLEKDSCNLSTGFYKGLSDCRVLSGF